MAADDLRQLNHLGISTPSEISNTMSDDKMRFGIVAMDVYFPSTFVEQSELGKVFGDYCSFVCRAVRSCFGW
jgi:hypothetical protein